MNFGLAQPHNYLRHFRVTQDHCAKNTTHAKDSISVDLRSSAPSYGFFGTD